MNNRLLIFGASAAAALAVAGCASPQIGKRAPDFELMALDNTKVELRQFRGQPVVIAFWGST